MSLIVTLYCFNSIKVRVKLLVPLLVLLLDHCFNSIKVRVKLFNAAKEYFVSCVSIP